MMKLLVFGLILLVHSLQTYAVESPGERARDDPKASSASAERPTVDADGTVHIPAFAVPLSAAMSARAKALYMEQARRDPLAAIAQSKNIGESRKIVDDYYRPLVDRGKALYPVTVEELKIAGVRTDIVTPKEGIAERNRARVLINLHGGGFQVGGGLGGLAEAIPIASVGKVKVVSVDYRMAPEHQFPAASEDVTAVYRELLKQYKPENIGIYGCSAGGMLTAEAVAWFQKEKLPNPGAIGLFCSGADADFGGGDSRYAPTVLGSFGKSPAPPPTNKPPRLPKSYLGNVDLKDPLVSPAVSNGLLEKFPPTLLIVGGRDPAMSSAVYTHSRLVKAGADADLHVWEGMWHNFLFEMDMPESIEAYNVIVKFFDKHLGRS